MLDSRRIALQGVGFPLPAISLAVQGLFEGVPAEPDNQGAPCAAVVGRGPGATINLSDYLKSIKRGNALLPVVAKNIKKHQRRREEEVLALAEMVM
jgi:hypothetical protein